MKQGVLKGAALGILIIFTAQSGQAINQSSCSTMLNNGFYKKYEYAGIDQPVTKATKKHGTIKSTSVTSTEGSTAVFDPKYWSNVSTSGTQGTSSWGECSLIGLQRTLQIRENYIAVNKSEVFKEIAKSEGDHLAALASLSMCDDDKLNQFSSALQKNLPNLMKTPEGQFNQALDKIISEDSELNVSCFNGRI